MDKGEPARGQRNGNFCEKNEEKRRETVEKGVGAKKKKSQKRKEKREIKKV